MTLVFYLVTKQTQWGYSTIKFSGLKKTNFCGSVFSNTKKPGKKCEPNKEMEKKKKLDNSVNNLLLLPQLKWEKGKEREKTNMVYQIQPQLQGEKEKRMV